MLNFFLNIEFSNFIETQKLLVYSKNWSEVEEVAVFLEVLSLMTQRFEDIDRVDLWRCQYRLFNLECYLKTSPVCVSKFNW